MKISRVMRQVLHFGAYVYDPNSEFSLGQQVGNWLNAAGAKDPTQAPNYNLLPAT